MPTHSVYDLWDHKTLNIVSNSTEYLRLKPKDMNTMEWYDLSEFNTIEWRLGYYGALSNNALISKKLVYKIGSDKYPIERDYKYFANGERVTLIEDSGEVNLSRCAILILGTIDRAEIQIEITSDETKNLSGGGYVHQIILSNVTSDGTITQESFAPFQGVIIVEENIASPFVSSEDE